MPDDRTSRARLLQDLLALKSMGGGRASEVPELLYLANLRRRGIPLSGNWRLDWEAIQSQGVPHDRAVELAQLYEQKRGYRPSAGMYPLHYLGEALQTLQKPFIAGAAALSQGAGPLKVAGEVLKSPFTSGRTFAEVPALRKLGKYGVLAADVMLDPLWFVGVGAGAKVGRAGRLLKTLEDARFEVALGRFRRVGKAGELGEPVHTLEEALREGSRYIGQKKGALKSYRSAAREFLEIWRKGTGKAPRSLDEVVGLQAEQAAAAGDLIRAGATGLLTWGAGTRRVAPLRALQARFAEALEARAASSPKAAQMGLKRVLELDRTERFMRRVRQARMARATSLSHLAGEQVSQLRELLAKAVPGGGALERSNLEHVREALGILQHGGRGAPVALKRGFGTVQGRKLRKRLLGERKAWEEASSEIDEVAKIHALLQEMLVAGEVSGVRRPEGLLKELKKAFKLTPKKAAERWQSRFRKLGVFFHVDPETRELRFINFDPRKSPFSFENLNLLGPSAVAERMEKLVEEGMDDALARYTLLGEVRQDIEEMALHVFGVKKGTPEYAFLKALEEHFGRLAKAEIQAGTLTTEKLGYLPRRRTPLVGKAAREHEKALGARFSAYKKLSGPLRQQARVPEGEKAIFQRRWGALTKLEIEDMLRQGKIESIGHGRTLSHLTERYKSQLGVTRRERWWAKLMATFGEEKFARFISQTEDEFSQFFFSDPTFWATMRQAEFNRAMQARDYTRHALETFTISRLRQEPRQPMSEFLTQVSRELTEMNQADPGKYRVVWRREAIPKSLLDRLGEVDDVQGFIFMGMEDLERLSAEGMQGVRGATAHLLRTEHAGAIIQHAAMISDPTRLQDFMRTVTRLTQVWKMWALFPRPAYHFRNFISNGWQMFLAGMRPDEVVFYYWKAMRLMRLARGGKRSFDLETHVDPRFLRGELTAFKGSPGLGRTFLRTPGGEMTAEETLIEAMNGGVLGLGMFGQEFTQGVLEELKGKVYPWYDPRMLVQKPVGRTLHAMARMGQQIENWSRLAFYLWQLEKKGISAAQAGQQVVKFFFNYADLRPWERRVRDVAIPFYSWLRFNIPLQIRQMLRVPARTEAPLRAALSLRSQSEISRELEPQWIANELGFPIKTRKDEKGRTQIVYGFMGSFMPLQDLLRIGNAVMFTMLAGGTAATGVIPGGKPAWAKNLGMELDEKGIRASEWIRYLTSGVLNPIAMKIIEQSVGFSFMRWKSIKSMEGDLVELPLGYVTTPEVANAWSLFPLWTEMKNLLSPTDPLGRRRPLLERVSRYLTGMPAISKGGFFGRYETDLALARGAMVRGLREERRKIIGRLRRKARIGKLTPESKESFLEALRLQSERFKERIKGAR